MSSCLFSHLKIILWLVQWSKWIGVWLQWKLPVSFPLMWNRVWSHKTNVARNDISELGFNHTLISRVPVNWSWLYDGMSPHLFLCYTQGNFWWIVRNGGSYLVMVFISQPWRKIGRRPGNIATSRTRNGGLGYCKPSPHYELTESSISSPWHSNVPWPSPDFSPRLQDKIWKCPGDEARCKGYQGLQWDFL